ncbi:hypothetical protein HJD18_03560 [Thermoleophilia bacterium SCSIO 60948]|nr:hypothetical protein HJD18_03560 [Thermoleophilia bacterium SCSIO 60948]
MGDDDRFEGLPGLERFRGELRAAAKRRREASWLGRNRWRVAGASLLAAVGLAVSPIGPAYGLLGDGGSDSDRGFLKSVAPVPRIIPQPVRAVIRDGDGGRAMTLRVFCSREDRSDKSTCVSSTINTGPTVSLAKNETLGFKIDAPAERATVVLDAIPNPHGRWIKVLEIEAGEVPGTDGTEWEVPLRKVRRGNHLQFRVEFSPSDAPQYLGEPLFRAVFDVDAARALPG